MAVWFLNVSKLLLALSTTASFHCGIDQALYVKDEVTGKEVLRYGGDFDDRPSDYEFSGDGIVFANRVEKPP